MSIRTASGPSHTSLLGEALRTCSGVLAPLSLATTPPFMKSSATLTLSAGRALGGAAQVEHQVLGAAPLQALHRRPRLVGALGGELGDLQIPRAPVDHPAARRGSRQPLADHRHLEGIHSGPQDGELHRRTGGASQQALAAGRGQGPGVATVDRLQDVPGLEPRLLGGRTGAGGHDHQEAEAAGEHGADVGVVLARLLQELPLVGVEIGAVAVEGVGQAEAGPGHRPVEVDGLDVAFEHETHDLVEDRELAVARVSEDSAQKRPDRDVGDEGGRDQSNEQPAASAHDGSIATATGACGIVENGWRRLALAADRCPLIDLGRGCHYSRRHLGPRAENTGPLRRRVDQAEREAAA